MPDVPVLAGGPSSASADLSRVVGFLRSIGLTVEEEPLPGATFLPGVAIVQGGLRYDPERLQFPGDLLHEAGHLAIIPGSERAKLDGTLSDEGGHEMGAIAWSYAALVELGLPPEVLFHDHGYRGSAAALRENFADGRYIGVPMLEWRGLTDYQRPGAEGSSTRYPILKQWLAD